jgi:hypothetical protein
MLVSSRIRALQLSTIAFALAAVAPIQPAVADDGLSLTDKITVPGNPLAAFDISFVDPALDLYALADRSNAGVDLIRASDHSFITRIGGFRGAVVENGKVNNDVSGPDGIVFVGDREIWAGDGDSTIKVIDLKSQQVTDTISTGGKARADELAYDALDHVILMANDADDPPFVTLISTDPGHQVLKKIEFPDATNGIEQSQWSPVTGMFYLNVPQVGDNPAEGEVAVIDPKSMSVVNTFKIENCQPAGMTLGPSNQALLGCAGNPPDVAPDRSLVIDLGTGDVVATITQVGGSDEVWFNAGDHRYYLAARNNPGGGVLGVIDADRNEWVENVPTSTTAHSVAADPIGNQVFVPLGAGSADNSVCRDSGCIAVFGAARNGDGHVKQAAAH